MRSASSHRHGPLQALAAYYPRIASGEAPGWTHERIGWAIVISVNGAPVALERLVEPGGTRARPVLKLVPSSGGKRTSAIAPHFLWDKTAYALGRTAKESRRTAREHAAFVELQLERLGNVEDKGLVAFCRFLERWTPERFDKRPFEPEMLDANVVFRLDGDDGYLHERPASRRLIEQVHDASRDDGESAFCLVTGRREPVARLHPIIKNVEEAQSSGAALVSFNHDAFESYGRRQGANAPVSRTAAFRYGAVLNRLLLRDGRNRVRRRIGDATTVFWAEASGARAVRAAERWFRTAFDVRDAAEARKVGQQLEAVSKGQRLSDLVPAIAPDTRFHVLGLSPNISRLSVRYWCTDTIELFAQRLAAHHADLCIEPYPWMRPPSVNLLLAQTTALQGKFENIPPLLAGEIMRSILTETPYPRAWLAATILRLRAGDDLSRGWHAAAIRAVLVRARRILTPPHHPPDTGETPMSLNRDHRNIAYQLGRLFAVFEIAQRSALRGIKTTIRDKYYGSASALPARVFPMLIANSKNHLARIRKDSRGWSVLLEREIDEIMDRIAPAMPFSLPRALRLEDQGEFAIGYYHQRSVKLRGTSVVNEVEPEETMEDGDEDNG